MFTHPALAKLEDDYQFRRVYFDQSMFGSEFEKTTQLIATPRLYQSLRPRFVGKVDTRGRAHKSLVGDVGADGTFASEAASAYPSEMNRSIADAFAEATTPLPTSFMPPSWPASPVSTPRPIGPPSTPPNGSAPAAPAADAGPMERWRQWVSDVPLVPSRTEVTDEAFHAAFQPSPLQHAQAAVRSAPGFFSEEMRWSGVDGQAFSLCLPKSTPAIVRRTASPWRRAPTKMDGPELGETRCAISIITMHTLKCPRASWRLGTAGRRQRWSTLSGCSRRSAGTMVR